MSSMTDRMGRRVDNVSTVLVETNSAIVLSYINSKEVTRTGNRSVAGDVDVDVDVIASIKR